jgi:hypothetical protein
MVVPASMAMEEWKAKQRRNVKVGRGLPENQRRGKALVNVSFPDPVNRE